MLANTQVSPLVATLVWLALLCTCSWLWIGHIRRTRPPMSTMPDHWRGSSVEGALLLSLMVNSRRWIARREDTVELVDGLWFERAISVWVDANAVDGPRSLADVDWVPLEMLPKLATTNVDIFTKDGTAVGRWARHRRLAEEGLATFAKSILRKECSPSTARAIRSIVSSSPNDAHATLRRLQRAHDVEALALSANPVFMSFAMAFAESELLLADVSSDTGEDRARLTFSYRHRLERPSRRVDVSRWRRYARTRSRLMSEALGWRVRGLPIRLDGWFQGREHIWTVQLPRLREQAAEIVTTLVTAPPRAGEKRDWRDADIREGALTQRLTDADPRGDYEVQLLMRPRRGSDLLAGMLFITGLIWAAMALGMVRLDDVATETEAMTALLAIVPSLILPLLWRREHPIVTFMFAGLRRITVSAFVAGLLAVLVLIGGYSGSALRWPWTAAFLVASAAFATASVSNLRSPRLPPELRLSGR